MNAQQKFQAIRLRAASRHPYLAEAILALIPVETSSVPRAAIDRYYRVYYNPEWILTCDDNVLVAVILHEFAHVIRRHFKRFSRLVGYDPQTLTKESITARHHTESLCWNLATDFAINEDLKSEGMPIDKVPGGAVFCKDYGLETGLTPEEYFQRLLEQADESVANQSLLQGRNTEEACSTTTGSRSEEEDGSGTGTERTGGFGDVASDDGQTADGSNSSAPGDGDTDGNGSGTAEGTAGGTGSEAPSVNWSGTSAVDGYRREWEVSKDAVDADGDEIGSISETEIDHLAAEVAKKIEKQAGRGTVPGGWLRWAQAQLDPQVPWQQVLRRYLSRSVERVQGCRDYTFSRVSRREPARPDLIASSPFDRRLKIRVAVDTSGSMGEDDLTKALSEIHGLLRKSPARGNLEVLSVDAALHTTQKIFKTSEVKLHGGGGTDMGLPIEYCRAEKAATRPDVLIICTDGETPWPTSPVPGVIVIAVITRESTYHDAPPNWIKSVQLN